MFAFWILFTSCATTTTTFQGFIFVPGHWTANSVLYGVPNCEIAVQKNEGASPNDGVLSCLVCSEGYHLVLTGEDGYQKHICEENPPPVLLECPSPEPCICEDCPTCEQCPTCEECPTMFELPETTFDATFLLESISGLFTMSQTNEPQQETTIEPGFIVLYCFVGLFILCMLVIILVLIIRKKKNQKVSSSGTMTEVDQTTVLPPSPSTFIPPPITLESFNPFELPEDERST